MFTKVPFKSCDITDVFFDSLKEDYAGFEDWFRKKSDEGAEAYISRQDNGSIQAFVYVKDGETEAVGNLPSTISRMKIGTLKICCESEGRRLGEGAVGLALLEWQRSVSDQIYVTVFSKHDDIIRLVSRFGFREQGSKGGEYVYVKDKGCLEYGGEEAGYASYPYLDPGFRRGVMIPIESRFHDRMFQFSKVQGNATPMSGKPSVFNGITKIYIATPFEHIDYRPGDIAFIYRIQESNKMYRSAITSYCTVASLRWFKKKGNPVDNLDYDDFVQYVGNKTVYDDESLQQSYSKKQVCAITLVYNGFFGSGSNVNCAWLKDNHLMDDHPYRIAYDRDEVLMILAEGGVDEKFAFVDKA